MHYCCIVFTEEFPTNEVIDRLLAPYNESDFFDDYEEADKQNKIYPAFLWDYWDLGGRYAGSLKLSTIGNEEEYRWRLYDKDGRNNRLFRSWMLDKIKHYIKSDYLSFTLFFEDDFYTSMGYRDGFLYVDACKVKDLINVDEASHCYACVNYDGEAFVRSWWNGEKYIDNKDFDKQVKNLFKENMDKYVTVIDLHE